MKRSYFKTAAAAKSLLLSNMTHDILYLLEQIYLIPAPFDTATRDMCNELVTVTHITSVPIKQLCFMLSVFFFFHKKKKTVLSDSRVKGGDGSNQFHLMIDQFVRNADQVQMLHSSLKM